MDGLFQHLDENCSLEILLNDIDVFIHADDTILISTGRTNFVQKCDEVVRYSSDHQLKLNWGKSGYLIINPKQNDLKCCIQMNSGVLKYKS